MSEPVTFTAGRLLPLWVKLPATGLGVILAGVGISGLWGGSFKGALAQLAIGLILVYTAGSERRAVLDDAGVTKISSFWEQRRQTFMAWQDIKSVCRLPGRGTRIYLRFSCDKNSMTLEFRKNQEDDVMEIVEQHISEDNITEEK